MRVTKRTVVAAFATSVLLVVPTVATASPLHAHGLRHAGAAATYGRDLGKRHHHIKRHHAKRHVVRKSHAVKAPGATPTGPPATDPNAPPPSTTTHNPALVEADDNNCTPQNVGPFMQAHTASILRMVITPDHPADQAQRACLDAARAEGYKIYLSIAYYPVGANVVDSTPNLAGWFRHVLRFYGQPWAVSVGNEESLWDSPAFTYTPADYVADWDTIAPAVQQAAPQALLIVGEADPWHANWDAAIADMHPVGADAMSFHCYSMAWSSGNTAGGQGGQGGGSGLDDVPDLAASVKADGLPLWCSEMAPRTDPDGAGFVQLQTLAEYQAVTQTAFDDAPDVQMKSWYEWPSIGAITPGI